MLSDEVPQFDVAGSRVHRMVPRGIDIDRVERSFDNMVALAAQGI